MLLHIVVVVVVVEEACSTFGHTDIASCRIPHARTTPPISPPTTTTCHCLLQMEKWRRLSAMPDVRAILGVHWALWFTTSGSQFTLMPILASGE